MSESILLTGATGFVGRYVLRELLRSHTSEVIALVRGKNEQHARQRMAPVLDWLNIDEAARGRLKVCCGDFTSRRFGETEEVRNCLSRCTTVVHVAANVSFSSDDQDEPATTNVLGTQQLLHHVGTQVRHWVQVSTAYVAPIDGQMGVEQEPKEADFRNEYEVTKAAAEEIVSASAAARRFSLTTVRPGIVVGEHSSGQASVFQGFYQPLRAIARLTNRGIRDTDGKVHIPLRVNLFPQEVRNLVPVDWVAQVISELTLRGAEASGIFHLTPNRPTTNSDVLEAVLSRWNIEEMNFHPHLRDHDMTSFERAFYRQLKLIAPYWNGEPRFDTSQLNALLPHLPCPRVDKGAVDRLLDYAIRADWGEQREIDTSTSEFPVADYLENFLPKYAPLSTLPRLTNVTAEVGFRVSGSCGGEWRCRLEQGNVISVQRASCRDVAVVFESDGNALGAIVGGALSPQQAFFDRRIEITGNIELGLKLAMIFGQFVSEFPFVNALKGGLSHVEAA